MRRKLTRRQTIAATGLLLLAQPESGVARMASNGSVFMLPIRWPDSVPGDGFFIRHGYACENAWYLPGYWHTGEDWYALNKRNTAGAEVIACADGEVVFAGSDYPGRVVIVQHEDELLSMYGHLAYEINVAEGESVAAGHVLGAVLDRTDGRAESHLHFEIRTFLTTPEVNGDGPRNGFACGYACAPGPGYWPIDAPEHPSVMGWRNPSHVIAQRIADHGEIVVVAAGDTPVIAELWPEHGSTGGPSQASEATLQPSQHELATAMDVGDEAGSDTSAEAYHIWAALELQDGTTGWTPVCVPSDYETGTDGRPSSVTWNVVFGESASPDD